MKSLMNRVLSDENDAKQLQQTAVISSFFVINDWHSNSTHITSNGKTPVCGTKMNDAKIGFEIKIDSTDKELKEYWKSPIQGEKWVMVAKHNYCQRCIKHLEKNCL